MTVSALLLPPISRPTTAVLGDSRFAPPFFYASIPIRNPGRNRKGELVVLSGINGNEPSKEEPEGREAARAREDSRKGQRPAFNLRWRDLLNPDPENILAVGLTGLLAWASVQVLWQLFFISLAILLAALKYSFIAAFLLFILITLL